MEEKKLDLKEFVNRINKEQLNSKDYIFYMMIDDFDYDIEPVWNTHNEVHELGLKDDGDNIFDEFSLLEIINADYFIEEIKENGNN